MLLKKILKEQRRLWNYNFNIDDLALMLTITLATISIYILNYLEVTILESLKIRKIEKNTKNKNYTNTRISCNFHIYIVK